jgi:hypothetical protein
LQICYKSQSKSVKDVYKDCPRSCRFTEDSKNVSADSNRYLEIVLDVVLPLIPPRKLRSIWWQQDGATIKKVMSLHKSKFGNRIISHFSDVNWPARSRDLNVLGYWLWSFVESEVHRQHSETLNDIQQLVEDVAPSLSTEMIHNAVGNAYSVKSSVAKAYAVVADN